MSHIEDLYFVDPTYQTQQQAAQLIADVGALTKAPTPERFHFFVEQLAIYGMSEQLEHLCAVSADVLTASRALRQFADQYRRFLDQCAKHLGSDFHSRTNLRLLSDVPQLVRRGQASDCLIIVVPTLYNNAMISLPLLDLFLEALGLDALYLKATHSKIGHYDGFYGFGSDADEVAEGLATFAKARGYGRVSLLGASSGGFSALWLGAKLEAERVCVYGSDITPTMRSKLLSHKRLIRQSTEADITMLADLDRIGHIHAYAGSLRSRDMECLTQLEGRENVTGRMVMGVGHMVLMKLISEGYRFEELAD
ncbi:MAG: hypothetical protein ACI9LZ_003667 [Glaciecola sp.]|jgi:hypothetical protein